MASLPTLGNRLPAAEHRTSLPMPKETDPHYGSAEHKAWRLTVCRRAGWRCEWVENGVRCDRRAPEHRMHADHIDEIKDGGDPLDPLNGQCLCTQHNTSKGLTARRERIASPLTRGKGG